MSMIGDSRTGLMPIASQASFANLGNHLIGLLVSQHLLDAPRRFVCPISTRFNAAASVVVMHNHPSGDSTPSEADVKVTRDLIRAGQLLKLELLDHVIVGNGSFSSLRGLGYFL
jgi:hypothetical protein